VDELDGLLAALDAPVFSPNEIREVPERAGLFLSLAVDLQKGLGMIADAQLSGRPEDMEDAEITFGAPISEVLAALGHRVDFAVALDPRFDDIEEYAGYTLALRKPEFFAAMLERFREDEGYERSEFKGDRIYSEYGDALAVSDGRLVVGMERPFTEDVLRQIHGAPRRLEPKLAASLPGGPVRGVAWCDERMLRWILREVLDIAPNPRAEPVRVPSALDPQAELRIANALGPVAGRATWQMKRQEKTGYLIELELYYR
jgi:hypothetical protein